MDDKDIEIADLKEELYRCEKENELHRQTIWQLETLLWMLPVSFLFLIYYYDGSPINSVLVWLLFAIPSVISCWSFYSIWDEMLISTKVGHFAQKNKAAFIVLLYAAASIVIVFFHFYKR